MAGRAASPVRRAAFVFLALAAAAVLAAVLGAAVPRPLFPPPQEPGGSDPSRRVLLLANPIHTDIALPAAPDVLARFAFLEEDGLPVGLPGVEWLVFGWGGRSFYLETPTWSELKPGPVARALTLDRSVMHVSVAGAIDASQDGVLAIDLSPAGFERLLRHVMQGFAVAGRQASPAVVEGGSYGEYDLFYEGVGRFNAFAGCNSWTASVLRGAGLRTGWWNPLPQSLLWSLRRHNPPGADQAISTSGSQP